LQTDSAWLAGKNLNLFSCVSWLREVSWLVRDSDGERERAGVYSWEPGRKRGQTEQTMLTLLAQEAVRSV